MAGVRKRSKRTKKATAFCHSEPALLAKAPAILWTSDLQFQVTWFAGSGVPALGLSPKHPRYSVQRFFQQSNSPAKAQDAHFLAARGESCSFQIEIAGRNLLAHVEPLHEDRGKIVGVIGVALDNTEALVSQRSLRVSEQSYRSLIEEAPHAICRCTGTGSLLQVNRAMQEMLGYWESDLLNCNLHTDIFTDPEHYSTFLDQLRNERSSNGFETQWLHRDGSAVSVSLSGRLIGEVLGEIFYLDLFAENISARKRLEDQLQHAQKMQAIGQLAGGIAHDFNNVLTIICGQADLMSQEVSGQEVSASRLAEIKRAAERAATLTRQLLAFSRRQVLQTKISDLNSIVANMNRMLARLIGDNIELSFRPDPNLWQVKVDPGQIEQVLMNLSVNARDAMSHGGRLLIETRNVSRAALGRATAEIVPGDYVVLSVRDTGCGMDEVTKGRIFEPFFTTKEVGKGTGLGLSVVYGVVKQSGGHVSVSSAPHAGSTFEIYLPRSGGAVEDVRESICVQIPRGNETILLVEDDESIRQLLEDFLGTSGYHVLCASEGAEAVRLIESGGKADLLLSDVMMPNMSGVALARRLKEVLPGLKVVLMSGHPQPPPSAIGMHFLEKPFSMHALGTSLREVLDGKARAAAAGVSR